MLPCHLFPQLLHNVNDNTVYHLFMYLFFFTKNSQNIFVVYEEFYKDSPNFFKGLF